MKKECSNALHSIQSEQINIMNLKMKKLLRGEVTFWEPHIQF